MHLKNRKAHGGPFDVAHHFIMIGIAAVLMKMYLDRIPLSEIWLLVVIIVIITLEIIGLFG